MAGKVEIPWPFNVWGSTLRLLRNGEAPHIPTLVAGLEGSEQIPDEVRKYMADYMAGRVKAPRGRPNAKNADEQSFQNVALWIIFRKEHELLKVAPRAKGARRDLYEIALERTAARFGKEFGEFISTNTIKNRLQLPLGPKGTSKK